MNDLINYIIKHPDLPTKEAISEYFNSYEWDVLKGEYMKMSDVEKTSLADKLEGMINK